MSSRQACSGDLLLLQREQKDEYLMEDMKKESNDSYVHPYLLVDLEKQKPYAIKVRDLGTGNTCLQMLCVVCYR